MKNKYDIENKVKLIHHSNEEYIECIGEIVDFRTTIGPNTESVGSDAALPSMGTQIVYEVRLVESGYLVQNIPETFLEPANNG